MATHLSTGNILLNHTLVIHNLITAYDAAHYHNIMLQSYLSYARALLEYVIFIMWFLLSRCYRP